MLVATTSEVASRALTDWNDDRMDYDDSSDRELRVHEVVFFIHVLFLPVCYWMGKRWGCKHRNLVLSGKEFTEGCCSFRMLAYLFGMFAAGLFGFFAAYFGFKHGEAQAVREYANAQSENVPAGEFMNTAAEAHVEYLPPQAPFPRRQNGRDETVMAMPATDDNSGDVDVYMAESSDDAGHATSQSKPLLQV
jgi:hypothetical protein